MTTSPEGASHALAPGPNARNSWLTRLFKTIAKVGLLGLGCIVIVLTITGWLNRDRIAIPPNYLGQYITVRGEQIRYYLSGTGPDLFLIHGLPGLVEDWKPILDAVAGKYRVTAYDRPGNGFSSAPTDHYSLAHNADVALELIDHLQLKDVIVVGHSYGGAVALEMATRNPPQVKAFVLLGSVTTPHEGGHSIFDFMRLPLVGRGLATIGSRLVGESMVKDGLKSSFSPHEALMTADFLEQRLPVFLQTKVIMTITGESSAINSDFAAFDQRFSAVSKPVHLIHGDCDKLVPVSEVLRFHDRFPATQLTVLKNTGHAIQFVRPEVVMSVVDALNK